MNDIEGSPYEDGAHPDTAKLLRDAARRLFASHGYDGTSIRDITREAGTNLGAVTYHFETKQRLYHAVVQELVGALWQRIKWESQVAVPPLVRLERMVRAIFEHIRLHPEMPAIMVRELASGRPIAPPILQAFGQIRPIVTGVIEEGQADGTVRPGDPTLLLLSMLAQPVYLNLARPVLLHVGGLDLDDDATRERIADHAVGVARAFLRNPDR